MAFFGLTALGRQNPFSAASKFRSNIHVFLRQDFEAAWKKVMRIDEQATEEKLHYVFRALFHGPIPDCDAHRIDDGFDGIYDGRTFSQYMDIMMALKEAAELEESREACRLGPAQTCDFSTQESLIRDKSKMRALQEKIQYPLTAQQEVIKSIFMIYLYCTTT
jgi:hypothetical protein